MDELFAPRQQHLFRGRRVKISDLLAARLLEPGDVLTYARPRTGELLTATVTEVGRLHLPDGRQITTPSGAIRALTDTSVDGWYAWVTPDGRFLHSLREELLADFRDDAIVASGESAEAHPVEFLRTARRLAEIGDPRRLLVRELIAVWGARSRDFDINDQIDADLGNHGLTTDPDFRAVTLDEYITIEATAHTATEEALVASSPLINDVPLPPEQTPVSVIVPVDEDEPWDHGLTIGNLPSASREIGFVTPQATFEQAITQMLTDDYSQLAVMTGPRGLVGAVSWKSIAQARHADPGAGFADAIIPAQAVLYTEDLITMLPVIQEHEFVFVQGSDRSLKGIVTLADVVDAYGQMASPFFMIGRIDQSLRRIIDASLPIDLITPICDSDGQRKLVACDQLTMGDYQRVLANADCWKQLGWPLDRKIFSARLDKIAKIRNNIMHFNNDPLPTDIVSMLRNFINLLDRYGSAI